MVSNKIFFKPKSLSSFSTFLKCSVLLVAENARTLSTLAKGSSSHPTHQQEEAAATGGYAQATGPRHGVSRDSARVSSMLLKYGGIKK